MFGPWTYLNLNHLNSTRFTTIRFAVKYSRRKPRRTTRRYCIYIWLTCQRYKQLHRWHVYKLYHTCTYNPLPEYDPSGSKQVERIVRIKILVYQGCVVFVYITRLYHNALRKEYKIILHSLHKNGVWNAVRLLLHVLTHFLAKSGNLHIGLNWHVQILSLEDSCNGSVLRPTDWKPIARPHTSRKAKHWNESISSSTRLVHGIATYVTQ